MMQKIKELKQNRYNFIIMKATKLLLIALSCMLVIGCKKNKPVTGLFSRTGDFISHTLLTRQRS